MLRFDKAQLAAVSQGHREAFATRLHTQLLVNVAQYAATPEDVRRSILEHIIDQGVAAGIRAERDLAIFSRLIVEAGPDPAAVLDHDDIRHILDDTHRGTGSKLLALDAYLNDILVDE